MQLSDTQERFVRHRGDNVLTQRANAMQKLLTEADGSAAAAPSYPSSLCHRAAAMSSKRLALPAKL